jgi:hypothetical protein
MDERMEVFIGRDCFSGGSQEFLKFGNLNVSLFKYNSGINAVKISNKDGHIIVLPFDGQQIWDAVFRGRRLTMGSTFEEPKNVDLLLHTYGAFLVHCGALRMGCPSAEDTHPLHGELPYAKYDNVKLIIGKKEEKNFIGISGEYEYNCAFDSHYLAVPTIRLFEDSDLLEISMVIKNMSNYPMELMYLMHVNFSPAEDGKIMQSTRWDKDSMKLRENLPEYVVTPESYLNLVKEVKNNPKVTQIIRKEDEYYPEMVIYLKNFLKDEEGWTHFIQVHKDGSSDYIGFRPEEFDNAARWLAKNKDQSALGLALPSTAEADGYIAEKKKGNIKIIPGKGEREFLIKTGYLDIKQTNKMREKIDSLIK